MCFYYILVVYSYKQKFRKKLETRKIGSKKFGNENRSKNNLEVIIFGNKYITLTFAEIKSSR